jgi:hypothetical protein
MEIVKSSIESYSINPGHSGWGIINVDSGTGALTITSDWGDYSYRWHVVAIGDDTLKEFLIRINSGYLGDKLLGHDLYIFDSDEAQKDIKKDICNYRREQSIEADEAREFYDEVGTLYGSDEEEFYECRGYESENPIICSMIEKLYDGDMSCTPTPRMVKPQFESFLKECWNPFIEFIKKEV